MRKLFASIVFVAVLQSAPTVAAEFTIDRPAQPGIEFSPYINKSFPQRVFWGDTHLHTTYSADAGMVGNFNLGPADAYRFAQGEQVQANNGMQVKLVRPLDFLVVAGGSPSPPTTACWPRPWRSAAISTCSSAA